MKTNILKFIVLLLILTGSFSSCKKEEAPCDCKNELYYYEYDNKKFLSDYLLKDQLLIGFYQQVTDTEIAHYVNQTGFFKPVNASDILDNKLVFVYNKRSKTYTSVVWHHDWAKLCADKKSKGNALQMANYFYETGKFVTTNPDLLVVDLKINK